jgi:CBS domain-containing protein
MKRKVSELLKRRDLSKFPSVQETASLMEALKTLDKFDVGSLMILRGSTLVGIFSERDFARAKIWQPDINFDSTLIPFLGRKIIYVTPEYTLEACLSIMAKTHVRHLPVIENNKPIALLSMRHIMEALIEERDLAVADLIKFVTGENPAPQNPDKDIEPIVKIFLPNRNA